MVTRMCDYMQKWININVGQFSPFQTKINGLGFGYMEPSHWWFSKIQRTSFHKEP
jgi:hypothetical protein